VGHSVALLAAGFHVLTDTLTYGLSLWVHVSATRKRSAKWPFGFARLDVIGGLIIGVPITAAATADYPAYVALGTLTRMGGQVSMLSGSALILLSASEHLLHLAIHEEGRVEHSLIVLVVAAVGIPFNLLGVCMFQHHGHGHSHGSTACSSTQNHNLVSQLSHRLAHSLLWLVLLQTGVCLHLAADAGGAVLIAASAAFIHFSHSPIRYVSRCVPHSCCRNPLYSLPSQLPRPQRGAAIY
jgi:Co/Zn/Cd efflux system component